MTELRESDRLAGVDETPPGHIYVQDYGDDLYGLVLVNEDGSGWTELCDTSLLTVAQMRKIASMHNVAFAAIAEALIAEREAAAKLESALRGIREDAQRALCNGSTLNHAGAGVLHGVADRADKAIAEYKETCK